MVSRHDENVAVDIKHKIWKKKQIIDYYCYDNDAIRHVLYVRERESE